MNYHQIGKYTRKYSFSSKMELCRRHSRNNIGIFDISIRYKNGEPLPWELDTFLLFAISFMEVSDSNLLNEELVFRKCISLIRNFEHPLMKEKFNGDDFLDYFASCSGLNQFELQESNLFKLYRYNCLFTKQTDKIDMTKIFAGKFGTKYHDFMMAGFLLNLIESRTISDYMFASKKIQNLYPKVISQLVISREDYIKKLNYFAQNVDDYLYCSSPSYFYPIVEYENVKYIPLPHCIFRACSSSLYYRITEHNDKLRTRMGIEVLEKYLFEITSDSMQFDEVICEMGYKSNSSDSKTSDIMCRKGDRYLFMESKSLVPSSKLRTFDDVTYKKEIQYISDYVNQVYKQIRYEFGKKYNFFASNQNDIDFENVFGLVVLLEDTFITRKTIYKESARKLSIPDDSDEFKWMINHIKIVSLHDVEKFTFTGCDILSTLVVQMESGRPQDYSLIYPNEYLEIKCKTVLEFKKMIENELELIKSEFTH